jgi:hypothetical protein
MVGIKGLSGIGMRYWYNTKTNYHYPAMRYVKLVFKVGMWEYVVDSWSKVQV